MANQNASIDNNRQRTLLGITDDSNAEVRRLLVDATTGRLKVSASVNLNGNVTWSRTAITTATYTMLAADFIMGVTRTTAGACTITLPTSEVASGRVLFVKDEGNNAGANNITIATQGSETIDGDSTFVIDQDSMSISIYSDGSNWFIF